MTKLASLLGLAVASALAACQPLTNGGDIMCTDNFVYGLAVYVKDSASGAWAASGATLYAVDQSGRRDSSTSAGYALPDSFPLLAAGEHAGTFQLTVRRPGYRDWMKSDVRVTADVCHVRPVQLTALLQPE